MDVRLQILLAGVLPLLWPIAGVRPYHLLHRNLSFASFLKESLLYSCRACALKESLLYSCRACASSYRLLSAGPAAASFSAGTDMGCPPAAPPTLSKCWLNLRLQALEAAEVTATISAVFTAWAYTINPREICSVSIAASMRLLQMEHRDLTCCSKLDSESVGHPRSGMSPNIPARHLIVPKQLDRMLDDKPLHNNSLPCNSSYVQARLSRHWCHTWGISVISLPIHP